jgi:hypothetical protein
MIQVKIMEQPSSKGYIAVENQENSIASNGIVEIDK